MELSMENYSEEQYKKAQKQVQKIKGFYSHLVFSIFAIAICIFINLKYTPQYLRFWWPFLGISMELFGHGMDAFNFFPFFNKDWEQKKIQKFMEEEEEQRNNVSKYN